MTARNTRVCLAGTLVLCGALMTFAAAAQTVPGTPKTPGAPSTTQTRLTADGVTPSCLKTNPFAVKPVDFVIQKVVAAGFTNVRGLYLGCDSIWRGHALQNGIDVAIMVTPTWRVLKAGY